MKFFILLLCLSTTTFSFADSVVEGHGESVLKTFSNDLPDSEKKELIEKNQKSLNAARTTARKAAQEQCQGQLDILSESLVSGVNRTNGKRLSIITAYCIED